MRISAMKPIIPALFAILVAGTAAHAKPVTLDQAKAALSGWLKGSPHPLNEPLTPEVAHIKASNTSPTLFYVAHLEPEGFVLLSPDDALEPILAFSSQGYFVENAENPLFALLQANLTAQLKQLANPHPSFRNIQTLREKACAHKWSQLIQSERQGEGTHEDTPSRINPNVNDPRVDPLIKSRWGQKTVKGLPVFNRFTPNRAACGSVATAIAQLVRYHEWPTQSIGDLQGWITVNGRIQMTKALGGDGKGGAYRFELMPYKPSEDIGEAEAQCLGALTHDAGLSVNMSYSDKGSFTDASRAARALQHQFKFSNAVLDNRMGRNFSMAQDFYTKLNSNLDAGLPVLMATSGTAGQSLLCDGYGHNMNTTYHHLNLGWSPSTDAWYKLPDMDTGYFAFESISSVVYNIFPQGSGECASGRVLDDQGKPLEGVSISLGDNLSQSNDRGIFAFSRIPSGRYVLEASKPGYLFSPQQVRVGSSSGSASGNLWGLVLIGTFRGDVSQRLTPPKNHHAQRKQTAR